MEKTVDLLATAKAVQKGRIGHAFRTAPNVGHEVAAGYVMDSSREDIDNLSRLCDRLIKTGTTSTTTLIRDKHNQFHQVTIAELSDIIGELIDFGLGLYAKKWQMEELIEAAATIEEVNTINW